MLSIDALRKEVEQWLKEYAASKREPRGLYEPLEYSLTLGGKRIRPVICLASCALFTDNYRIAKPVALALEVFHNFTLLHDDLMDNSSLRRNKPTVCAKWDANTAVLSGDLMMIESYRLLAQTDSPVYSQIYDTFTRTAIEVCEGQQFDMEFESRDDVTVDEYMEMIRLKTAVLFAASVKIGAMVGGAYGKDCDALYSFASDLGLAFQLRDDLLDTYGDEATFGKAIGGDIMENKKTYLLISALDNATSAQRERLQEWIGKVNPVRDEKVKAVTAIYDAIGVKSMTEKKINELYNKAMQTLREMEISAEGKRFFADFADGLLSRNR